jgi:hypothetical protein
MAWRFEGSYFENCSCDMLCPCTYSGFTMPATRDRCRALLAFHIDRGDVDGTAVDGLSFGLFIDSPQVMADGNWRVGLFLDAAASPEQSEHLSAVLSGSLGGPPAMLGPLIGEMLGVEKVPFDYADAGRTHRVRIGDDVEIEVEDYVPPGSEGDPVQLRNVVHPANTTLTVGRATRSRITAFGIDLGGEGQNSLSAPFSWSA